VPPPAPRTLADVLDAALAGGAGRDVPAPGAALAGLRDGLEDAARAAAAGGGWTEDDPLRLTKGLVTGLLRCPRRAVAGEPAGGSDDLVAGLVVDAAAKLATLVPQRRATLDAALDFLAAAGDTTVADRLADLGDAAGTLRADVGARVDRLVAAWPPLDPAWWPRVEEPVRVRLAGGAVTASGRLDLVLGGRPSGRPTVVVEVKGGRWYDGMRADGHLYALLLALRDGEAPAAVVTVVADGTTQVEPLRPALLAHAAERLEEAMALAAVVAAGLAAGEAPVARPGTHCGHCPVAAGCTAGQAWRAGAGVPAAVDPAAVDPHLADAAAPA
jgi:PD-(D/E)XK nuclease superfamily